MGRPLLQVKVGQVGADLTRARSAVALIDTGASNNVMSHQEYQDLGFAAIEGDPPPELQNEALDGQATPLRVLAKVQVNLSFVKFPFAQGVQTFLILEKCSLPGLMLGIRAIHHFHIVTYLDQAMLLQPTDRIKVVARKFQTLKAQSAVPIVAAIYAGEKRTPGIMGTASHIPGNKLKPLAALLQADQEGKVCMVMMNNSPEEVTIQ